MSDPNQDPSTFDPDEDLFNFDEVALEFYSSDDEEDLEAIFAAFEAGVQGGSDIKFDFDAIETPEVEPSKEPSLPTPPTVAETTPAPAPPVEVFRADTQAVADPMPAPAPPAATVPAPEISPKVQHVTPPQPEVQPVPAAGYAHPPIQTYGHGQVQGQPPPGQAGPPPQVYPSPVNPGTHPVQGAPAAPGSRFPILKRLKDASPILLAVTLMNTMLAVVVMNRPTTPTEAPVAELSAPYSVPTVMTEREVIQPSKISVPKPERHPTFALAHEEIERGEYGLARRRIYGLLSIVDRLNTDERAVIEARAHYLLAEAQHLEALGRMEDKR